MSKLETLIHLTDSNVGDWVTYCPNEWSDHETGKIKSFDNARQVAWVVYKANGNWDGDHWKDYTAQLTNYSDLIFKHEYPTHRQS